MWLLDFKKTRESVDDLAATVRQLRLELNELAFTVNDLREDMKRLQDLNAETQKTNVLLYPENFDKNKSDGKTIFVKNGEEKPYDTIDWRSR
jgi:hypothetical protein